MFIIDLLSSATPPSQAVVRRLLTRAGCLVGLIAVSASSVGVAWSATAKDSSWTSSAGRSRDHQNPRFELALAAQQAVTIDLESSVDTFLYLLDAEGTEVARDDNSGTGLNSRITVTLPAGSYQLVAATYRSGRVGSFTIRSSHGVLHRCFFAYEDAHYGGAASQFCGGAIRSRFRNDDYSSLRVPKGMYVRASQHGNGSGFGHTYFRDCPWVGDRFNDEFSRFVHGDFEHKGFYMAVLSDPQFAWPACADYNTSDACDQERKHFGRSGDVTIARYYNVNVVNAINWLKDSLGESQWGGAVVNGDLTEFGDQGPDLDDYVDVYEHGLDMNLYPGLGNHDIENNVDDCARNKCASNMVLYLRSQVEALNPLRFDLSERSYYKFPSRRMDYKGSLGYSWDIGDVHFVQLNNHPTYTKSWDRWNYSKARVDHFKLQSAISWLEDDLDSAQADGKTIIVNMHDWGADSHDNDFKEVLANYDVTATFAGHWHGTFRRYRNVFQPDGYTMPVFISGAPHYGTFFVTKIENGKMYVWRLVVDHFNDAQLQVLHGGASTPVTPDNVAEVFDVDAAQYYDYDFDVRSK